MKRAIFIPITVLVLLSLSCGLFSKTTSSPESVATAPEAITVILEEEKPTATEPMPEPEILPSSTKEQPTNIPEATATEAPTETPAGPVEYSDTFDRNTDSWSDDVVITTQTSGRDLLSKSIILDGMLNFSFNDKETYMYKYFLTPLLGNVSIEADYQAIGHINNGIALICKVNDERTSWFEVRVSSTSDFNFYLYDQRRKTVEGKNPYLLLGKGKLKIDELYPSKPNTVKLTCLDSELVLDANNGKRVISQVLEAQLDGSGVGLGAMSYDVTPIKINFDQVLIREER